jgi:hypothetical protein
MKNGKRQATPEKREQKSRGAVWAEQTRKRCNLPTDVQREKLLDRAMQIAYVWPKPRCLVAGCC